MQIRFWGVRGSVPWATPTAIGHGCNTPCLEITDERTGATLVLDAGSDTSRHGVLQPCPIAAGVAQGTEPRTPQNLTCIVRLHDTRPLVWEQGGVGVRLRGDGRSWKSPP